MKKSILILFLVNILYITNLYADNLARDIQYYNELQEIFIKDNAILKIPTGFSAKFDGSIIELLDPEDKLKINYLAIENHDYPIKQAWYLVNPSANYKLQTQLKPPIKKPFSKKIIEFYFPNHNDNMAKLLYLKKDKLSFIMIIEGNKKDILKRDAQLNSFFDSLTFTDIPKVSLKDTQINSIKNKKFNLDSYIEKAMKNYQVPGLEIAIIEDNKLLFSDGYGLKNIHEKEKVNADTIMMIGSISKSITSFLAATLVDQNVIAWDQKIINILPDYRLGSIDYTNQLSIEKSFCACAGFPRKDFEMLFKGYDKNINNLFDDLQKMYPTTGIGETYQYQNQIYALGGFAIAEAAEDNRKDLMTKYRHLIHNNFFEPLGMNRSFVGTNRVYEFDNIASGHDLDLYNNVSNVDIIYEKFVNYISPAGAIYSSANDLAKYILMELNEGETEDETRIISKENLLFRRQPQVKISEDFYYGLGWRITKFHDIEIISHTGATMGYSSFAFFIPEKKVGAVILNNNGNVLAMNVNIYLKLLEMWFNIDEKAKEHQEYHQQLAKMDLQDLKQNIMHDYDFTTIIGAYNNTDLGEILLYEKDGKKYFKSGIYRSEVKIIEQDGKQFIRVIAPPFARRQFMIMDNKLILQNGQEEHIFSKI